MDCSYSVPDWQLVRRVASQVEFHLSDENLAKDAFLLKHVQKNKMGFVSIKLLMSLKKVGSPLRWPAGVGSGLHVEDARVSGCALAVCGEVLGEVQALLRKPVSRQSAGGAELGPAVCLQRAAAVLHPGRVAVEAVRGPQTPSPGLGSPLLPVVPPGCFERGELVLRR